MNPLDEIIRTEIIGRDGRIPFARLMELALYCPQFGYYDRIENKLGRDHDYFTSVSTGPLFGNLLAFQFTSWLDKFRDVEVQVLEAGAHDGRLAFDILSWLDANQPELLRRLQFWILEPLKSRMAAQRQTLGRFAGKVSWFHDWHALPRSGVRGVIFSNELLDAMPVHRLGWDASSGKWFEWGVAVRGTGLDWTRLELEPHLIVSSPLARIPAELLAVLPDSFTTEICPAATDWWSRAAKTLRSGQLMTLDYGLETEQFFRPERSNGTLRAYLRHQVNSDLLTRLGEQDLTAHVNFTVLREAGEAAGLRTEGTVSQSEFLTRILAAAAAEQPDRFATPTWKREFQTLTHPEHLGRAFKVLVQSRQPPTASE